jgi:alkanesulfonate monooxygenase SsuD/methylene tetrahydromethanopterin reductase-like flavin-dependent oxidoreductase (luciferase family)
MLGLGAGHKSVIENRHGLSYDRPTLRMREITEIVRRALTGEAVNFEGEIFRLSGAQLSAASRPEQRAGLHRGNRAARARTRR